MHVLIVEQYYKHFIILTIRFFFLFQYQKVRNHIYFVKDNCFIVLILIKFSIKECMDFPKTFFLFINCKLNYKCPIYLTRNHVILKYRKSP